MAKVGGWLDLPKSRKVGGWLDLPKGESRKKVFHQSAESSKAYDPRPMDEAWSKHFHAWSGMKLGS
jgi:hypothetical protein